MRVLIVAAVLACAAAAPSGLLAAPYNYGYAAPLAVAHAAPVAVASYGAALPTISPGDIAGAAIDAHVEANDHARAAVDSVKQWNDKAAELQGQAVNAAVENTWQAIDAVKTQEAQLDGAAAGVSPVLAKQLVRSAPIVAAAPVAAYAGVAAHGVVAAPALTTYSASHSTSSQSLTQTHPSPALHATYAVSPLAGAYAAPLAAAHGYSYGLQRRAW